MKWIDAFAHNPALAPARRRAAWGTALLGLACVAAWAWWHPFRPASELLHVSYQASRPYFEGVGTAFMEGADDWTVRSTYAGSMSQTAGVARGLVADTLCVATPAELDHLARTTHLVAEDWREAFPHQASPFTSTVVLLVRAGNPRGIHDWADLERADVALQVTSPRVSGAGCYAYLALLTHALEQSGGDGVVARQWVADRYLRARILDLGAQQALRHFARESAADVLLTWESEARRAVETLDGFEIVYPAASIRAEPVVAILGPQAERRGTLAGAQAYLAFLFSEQGQALAAREGFRPRSSEAAQMAQPAFPMLEQRSVDESLGGWEAVWADHLGPSGSYAHIERLLRARAGGSE
ncbi:MAG: sulfate ABC transporter substrate-binding protein [Verrucomicrobiota bacterium JB022]|nr:sulfate ABC transporter substrate-binding protein [Verrucomicrobiota bacterium JB022]